MRDQLDAQIWNDHHDQFSEWLDGRVAAAGASLRRGFASATRVPPQFVAATVAIGVTLMTFTASGA